MNLVNKSVIFFVYRYQWIYITIIPFCFNSTTFHSLLLVLYFRGIELLIIWPHIIHHSLSHWIIIKCIHKYNTYTQTHIKPIIVSLYAAKKFLIVCVHLHGFFYRSSIASGICDFYYGLWFSFNDFFFCNSLLCICECHDYENNIIDTIKFFFNFTPDISHSSWIWNLFSQILFQFSLSFC